MTSPTYAQRTFRIRKDNGSESGAGWYANANTNATVCSLLNLRVRLEMYNNNARTGSTGWTWQYNRNSAGWNPITSISSYVQSAASANFSDGDTTTQQIGSGSYDSANVGMDDSGSNASDQIASGAAVEIETCIKFLNTCAESDAIQIRVVSAAGYTITYTVTPSITVTLSKEVSKSETATATEPAPGVYVPELPPWPNVTEPAIGTSDIPELRYDVPAGVLDSAGTGDAPVLRCDLDANIQEPTSASDAQPGIIPDLAVHVAGEPAAASDELGCEILFEIIEVSDLASAEDTANGLVSDPQIGLADVSVPADIPELLVPFCVVDVTDEAAVSDTPAWSVEGGASEPDLNIFVDPQFEQYLRYGVEVV